VVFVESNCSVFIAELGEKEVDQGWLVDLADELGQVGKERLGVVVKENVHVDAVFSHRFNDSSVVAAVNVCFEL